MGLKRPKNYKGIICQYWKILSATEDVVAGKTLVELGLYFSSETRQLGIENYFLTEKVMIEGTGLTRSEQYIKVKETENFLIATDC